MPSQKKLSHELQTLKRERRLKWATDIDHVKAYYLDGAKLPARLEEKRKRMEVAHSLLLDGLSKNEVLKQLSLQFGIERTQCYIIMKDALSILGDITATTKAAERYLIIEQYQVIATKAKEANNLELWKECLDAIAKAQGLHHEDKEGVDWSKVFMPTVIQFTSNPAALHSVQDIDYEPAAEEADLP